MCKALDVAKLIVEHENDEDRIIDNLRLQKLLYFVQAEFYAESGKPCFSDNMEAWQFGAVVPEVYLYFRAYGKLDVELPYPAEKAASFEDPSVPERIKNIVDLLASYTTDVLIDVCHKQDPWKLARNTESKIITHESMRQYFAA